MASFGYSALATTVYNLLVKFGASGCRVVRPASSETDPDKPWKGFDAPDVVIIASCTVLLGGLSRLRIGGPEVLAGKGESPSVMEDSTVFMAGADGALTRPGDFLEVPLADGTYDRLAVERIAPLKPGGTNLMWQLKVVGA